MPDVALLEPAFGAAELDNLHEVRLNFPGYYPAGAPRPEELRLRPRVNAARLSFAPGLRGRADVARYSRRLVEAAPALAASEHRLPYLRGIYADEGESIATSIGAAMASPGLADAARNYFGAKVVSPQTMFANVYLPGQRLGVHTDVPAFRGADRGHVPPWLLVVMHHSGLFERWHIKVATAVCYLHRGGGGALRYYPVSGADEAGSGAAGSSVEVIPAPNAGVMLDADTIFHEVEPVPGDCEALDDPPAGLHLVESSAEHWELRSDTPGERSLARFGSDQIRFSVSWKAYCFEDEAAHDSWVSHRDDLPLDQVVPRLVTALEQQGALPNGERRLSQRELGEIMIDHFVRFPVSP